MRGVWPWKAATLGAARHLLTVRDPARYRRPGARGLLELDSGIDGKRCLQYYAVRLQIFPSVIEHPRTSRGCTGSWRSRLMCRCPCAQPSRSPEDRWYVSFLPHRTVPFLPRPWHCDSSSGKDESQRLHSAFPQSLSPVAPTMVFGLGPSSVPPCRTKSLLFDINTSGHSGTRSRAAYRACLSPTPVFLLVWRRHFLAHQGHGIEHASPLADLPMCYTSLPVTLCSHPPHLLGSTH